MNRRRRVDMPEKKKLEVAKLRKSIIQKEEKKIKELKKAIEETDSDFAKAQFKEELKLMEDWLAKYKKDPNTAVFDEFAPLYEKTSSG